MNSIKVGNVNIGEGIPKICVPLVASTGSDVLNEAETIRSFSPDIVEWRVDSYDGDLNPDVLNEILTGLRDTLGDIPLIFTYRTSSEGGSRPIDDTDYISLNEFAVRSRLADIVDIELRIGEEAIADLIEKARKIAAEKAKESPCKP